MTLYAVLGVPAGASGAELKAAWRSLARKLHPDRHPDDPAASKRLGEVNAAYAVLSDPDQRAQYDRYGADAASAFFDADLAEAARTKPPPRPRTVEAGEDIEVELALDPETARRGGPIDVVVEPARTCVHCQGTGWRRAGRACSKCEGGTIPGIGPFRVLVPVGVVDGQVLLVPGSGRAGRGRGALHGDLRVVARVPPSFRVEAAFTMVDVPCASALLKSGGKVRVPLPDGRAVRMVVPEGSVPGRALRLRGKGRSGGDLLAVLVEGPSAPVVVQAVAISLS